MGLDMYLYAEKYVSRNDWDNYDRDNDDEIPHNPAFDAIVSMFDAKDVVRNGEHAGIRIMLPVGYWRKANAIHAWIVDNCADGVDKCQIINMSRETVNELLDICIRARDTRDASELPPRSGFFFGSTEVDEWYWEDINRTIFILRDALSLDNDYFEYQASW